ncbi:MAG: DUF1080 domain-containing protein [Candidatus Latescibacterota bacterium]|nr:MAG: DUF1080 domain-containing protein [Candidatus Latescibacterota bacterium]
MDGKLGYDDTPFLPGSKYRVHDADRPHPRVVVPGAKPGDPPSDAIVLFDGTDLSGWISVKDGGEAKWKVEDGYMEVVPGTGNIRTKEEFGDCQLHIEWAAPAEVRGESQGRGNSGVFLMGLYEIQVLDCYENPTYADGWTAAIYGQYPPLVSACRKPGEWQTYDIIWEAPRFEGDKLVRPAYLTLIHNGVVVHNHTALFGRTGHKRMPSYQPHPPIGPLMLQDHGDPVRFRNIWYRVLTDYDQG